MVPEILDSNMEPEILEIPLDPPVKRPRGNPKWVKGQSGNPAGRKPGSKHKIAASLIDAFCADFEKHGHAAIERVRKESPVEYVKLARSFIPKEEEVTHTIRAVRMLTEVEWNQINSPQPRLLASNTIPGPILEHSTPEQNGTQ